MSNEPTKAEGATRSHHRRPAAAQDPGEARPRREPRRPSADAAPLDVAAADGAASPSSDGAAAPAGLSTLAPDSDAVSGAAAVDHAVADAVPATRAQVADAPADGRVAAPAAEPAAAPPRAGGQAAAGSTPAVAPSSDEPVAPSGYVDDPQFLADQRKALLAERETYLEQASSLRAEAELLIAEMEPGDVQFDEESGEGGTVTVDRERDLALSAQALAAVQEIDVALAKMDHGRYGICEGCGQLIVKPRLEALPYARLCIACKSGGLSRR